MKIRPFTNLVKFIPKDRRGRFEKGQVYPADHFEVSATDIAAAEAGASADLINPDGGGAGNSGGGPGVSIATLVPSIVDIDPTTDQTISATEPTTTAIDLEVSAGENRIDAANTTFQWQLSIDDGTSWSDISGEISTTLSLQAGLTSSQSGYQYRCKIENAAAVNSPSFSGVFTLEISRIITITAQPVWTPTAQGITFTLNATATISSSTLNYQWQKKESDSNAWINISGESGTSIASGTQVSYTTPILDIDEDTDDQYRVVFTGTDAPDVYSNIVTAVVLGFDFRIEPEINGVEFWDFEEHGTLIFDPSNSTAYTVTSLSSARNKFTTKIWGQGTCAGKGGHTDAQVPLIAGQKLKLLMNSGGGLAGPSDSGRYAEAGGGYAGIFDTSVSHANALAIAGGAGGSSLNMASSCGGSQSSVSYPYTVTTSYSCTTTQTVSDVRNKSGAVYHSYNNASQSNNALYWSGNTAAAIATGHWPPRGYYVYFNTGDYFKDANYNLSVYTGAWTAGGGAAPGFYTGSLQKYFFGFLIYFQRADNGYGSYVANWSWNAYANYSTTISVPTTCYTSNTYYYNHTGKSKVSGGSGGGASGSDGADSTSSSITATGGDGGTSSTGGAGGTTTSGGSTNGNSGSSLQGGSGGSNSGSYAAAGGGGGGGGYYGGGGGAGGYDGYNGSSDPGKGPQSGAGGAGGSGYVHPTASGNTSLFAGESDTNRGNAGDEEENSRIVIEATYINITSQPQGSAISAGTSTTFTVGAEVIGQSSSIINYQWQLSSSGSYSDISGATSSSYTTPTLSTTDSGNKYRCIISNDFSRTKITSDAVVLVLGPGNQQLIIDSVGLTTIDLADATDFTFKIWGAGGGGTGECPSGSFSGGSGAYAAGTISNVGAGDSLTVFVGSTGLGDSAAGMSGYGAGRGGQRSELAYTRSGNTANWYVGGGGGAGQNGQGGGGGAPNGSAGSGTGPNAGGAASSGGGGSGGGGGAGSGTTGRSGGGASGGAPYNQGNRGGGGGSGFYGGGGGGGQNTGNNCTGGGAGGGSGYVSVPSSITGDLSATTYTSGSQGSSSGAAAPYNNDPNYVTGRGANSGNGLAIIDITVPQGLLMTGVNTNTATDISDLSSTTTLTEPVFLTAEADYDVTVRLRGNTPAGSGGTGGYVQGTVRLTAGNVFRLQYDSRYAALFYGTGTNGGNCIMLAAEGGYQGNGVYGGIANGGNAGYPSGNSGSNQNASGGGGGGTTSGYKSGSGGGGGYPGASDGYTGAPGTNGGFFSAGYGGSGVDGNGGQGGMGYYGGGGGGGGWDLDYNAGGEFGGGGGGGSSYYGGLPSPSVDPSSPAEITVSSTSHGTESGSPQIQIISVAAV